MMFDEVSLAKRRERLSGAAVLKQIETMHVYTRYPITLPTKRRKHYQGTNAGDCVGPIQLDDWSS
eukprot:5104201-Pyramimonas_sp.AAC.1